MKLSKWALLGAVFSTLCVGVAFAQTSVRQPSANQRAAYEYSSYYSQQDSPPSPSDEGPPAAVPMTSPEAAAPSPACACAPAAPAEDTCSECSDDCPEGCCLGGPFDPCAKLTDPWKLFDCEGLKARNINVAGYIAQSFTANPQNPSDGFNGPLTWTDRSNQYQLNQFLTYVERSTNTDGHGWDFGGRADMMMGTDYRFNTESNLETRTQFTNPYISTQRFYGIAFTQFYAEIARNNLKVKVGHFYSPVGYEGVQTAGNFFTTLPYTFQYGEPFTHTGVLGTWTVNEKLTLGAGIIRGWDNFGNNNPGAGFLGTLTRTFDDGGSLAIVDVISREPNQNNNVNIESGFGQGNNNAHSYRFLQTNVYSRPLKRISEKLNYVYQTDFGYQTQALVNGRDAKYYGQNQYLFYKVSDTWTWGLRAEWFRDEEGFRVGGFESYTPSGSLRGLSSARSGYAGVFTEITFGANWKMNANTVVRPMIRYDSYNGVEAAGESPYGAGYRNQQFIFGGDVVTLF